MTTPEEIRERLQELRQQKISLEEPHKVNIARGTIGDEELEQRLYARQKQLSQSTPSPKTPLPPPPAPPYAREKAQAAQAMNELQQALQAQTPHRLYGQQQAATAPAAELQTIRGRAPAEQAGSEELLRALSEAHAQLTAHPPDNFVATPPLSRHEQRRLEREQRRQSRAGEASARTEARQQLSTAPAPQQELTFQDLLATGEQTPAGAGEEKPRNLFDELEATTAAAGSGPSGLFAELQEVSGAKPAERKESVTQVQVEKNEPLACPTCKAANTRVVFCPYCGTGMCANCSPSIKPEGDFFVFTCPHCSEEVNVKKTQ